MLWAVCCAHLVWHGQLARHPLVEIGILHVQYLAVLLQTVFLHPVEVRSSLCKPRQRQNGRCWECRYGPCTLRAHPFPEHDVHLQPACDAVATRGEDAPPSQAIDSMRCTSHLAAVEQPPTIDVGARPPMLRRALQAAAGGLVLALLTGCAVTIFLFFIQLLVAYLVATEVLGLRIDLRPEAA